jgi:gliding motility-associated-like protein
MKNIYLLFCILCSLALKSQTVFWGETFGIGTTCSNNQGTLANGFNSSNGVWSINTSLGTNDALPNVWYISQTEGGQPVGSCGAGCLDTATITNRTLHIGAAQNSPTYGTVCPTGDCGAIYDPGFGLNQVRTNVRAESPVISTVGKTGVILQFDYVLRGNKGDSLNVWAFDGAVWVNLGVPVATGTCTSAIPGDTVGKWAQVTYNLSANFNNNGAVKIGFQWINNDDGKGGNPSVAIDNIELLATSTGGGHSTLDTVAVFSPDTANHNFIYCTNTPYHFTGYANPGPILAYQWYVYPSTNIVFNPAHPGLGQSGVDITFPTTGTYTVTVIASSQYNGIDSSTAFVPFVIHVNQTPTVTVVPLSPVYVCQGGTGTNLYATATSTCTYVWSQAATVVPPTYLDANGDSVNVNPPGTPPHQVVTYSVVGTTTIGCASPQVVVTVSVQPKPTPVYSPTDTICSGSSATLFVTNMPVNTTYHWGAAFGAGLGSSSGASVIETPIYYNFTNSTADTTIIDTVIVNVKGCPSYPYHISRVIVKPTPIAHVLADTVDNCNKMGAVLGAVGTPTAGLTYNWSPGTALSSTTGSPVTAKPTVTTTYYMTPVRDGCPGLKDSVKVFIGDTTNASITSEYDIICNSQTNQFIAYPQNGQISNPNPYHYEWTPQPLLSSSISGDTVVVMPSTNTVYTLTVYGTCVKRNIVTYGITVNNCTPPKAGFTESSDTICVRHCITFKDTAQYHSTKPLFYTFIFPGQTQISPVLGSTVNNGLSDTLTYAMTNNTPLKPIRACFNVNSTNNNCASCPQFFTITEIVKNGLNQTSTYKDSIIVYPGPYAHAGADQTIDQGTTTNLDASTSSGQSGIISYNWTQSDSGYMSCNSGPACIKPAVTPSITTQYVLVVLDKNGCTSTDSVTINVDIICKDVYIATAFSPNSDGLNDVLHVKSNCTISQFSFKIFDRWGEKVFESNDPTYGWDGTFRNKVMDSAVFMYTVDGFLSSGTEVKKKGNVSLIR